MKDVKIFYVDDDCDDLNIFKDAASEIGVEANVFDNGYKLLAELEEVNPLNVLVFADLNMPVINGYELVAAIRKSPKFKSIPIICFSTSQDSQSVDRCKNAGASLYLQKPSSFQLLIRKIQHVLKIDWQHLEETDFFCKV